MDKYLFFLFFIPNFSQNVLYNSNSQLRKGFYKIQAEHTKM